MIDISDKIIEAITKNCMKHKIVQKRNSKGDYIDVYDGEFAHCKLHLEAVKFKIGKVKYEFDFTIIWTRESLDKPILPYEVYKAGNKVIDNPEFIVWKDGEKADCFSYDIKKVLECL